jgi:hypothetical protein
VNAISGRIRRPSIRIARSLRNLNPAACKADRSRISGRVFVRLTAAIFRERWADGVTHFKCSRGST